MPTEQAIKTKLDIINHNRKTIAIAKIKIIDSSYLRKELLNPNNIVNIITFGFSPNQDLNTIIADFSSLSKKDQKEVCSLLTNSKNIHVNSTKFIFQYDKDPYILNSFTKISKSIIIRSKLLTDFLTLDSLPYCEYIANNFILTTDYNTNKIITEQMNNL